MPYIGNNHIAGDHTNNFKVLDDISSFTATFDGSATSVVDTTNNTIRVVEHRFIQGQRVTYTNGSGGNIGGLTTGTAYFVIFDSASTIKLATSASNAANSTAINLSAVGTGSSHTLNAAFDGVNTKFKITYNGGTGARFNNATQLNIAINNVLQKPNVNSTTFTEGFAVEDNHKIVFQTAPTSEDIFWGSIIANTLTTFDISDHKIDTFTGDGSTTEFTLSHTPANNESLMVTINGVLQHPSNASTARAYTLIASIIQFTAAPGVGDEIQVRHLGFAGATTADVSGFYGRTGNVVLTSNDHITTGNINAGIVTATSFHGSFSPNVGGSNANFTGIVTAGTFKGGNIDAVDGAFSGNVTIGGTLTYEDVTNIDSVGIITAQTDVHVGAGLSVVGVTTLTGNILAGGTSIPGYSGADDLTIGAETGHHGITIRSGATNNGGLFFSDDTVGGSNANQWAGGIEYNHPNSELRFYVGNGWRSSFTGAGHFIPYTDSSINIGSSSKRFANVYSDNLNLSANATITGDIDVDGHTNLDNVSIAGVTTFSDTVHVGTGVTILNNGRAEFTGFTTFAQGLEVPFYKSINIGSSLYGKIYYPSGGSSLVMQALNQLTFKCWTGNNFQTGLYLNGISGLTRLGGYNMGNNGSKAPQLDVTGHTTQSITMKSSDGSNLTERFRLSQSGFNFTGLSTHTGNFDLDGDLDVDGHTNLDNVSIAGVTTFSNNVKFDGATAGRDVTFIRSSNTLEFATNAILELGNGGSGDCRLFNNGTDTRIINGDGTLKFESDTYEFKDKDNTTSYLNITSAGDIGIGYNSPTVKLHIRENASGFSGTYDNRYHCIIENNAEGYLGFYMPDNGYAGLRFLDTTGLEGYIDYYFGTDEFVYASTGSHKFKTAGSEKMVIQSGGNVMIGGNYTSTNLGKLCVDGVIGIDDEGSGTSTLNIMTAANTRLKIQATGSIAQILTQNGVPFAIKTDAGTGGGTERLRIDTNGHLHTGYTSGFGNDHINILASDGGGVSIASNNAGNATTGDILGSLSFQGYLNTQTYSNAEARISAVVTSNHTGTSAATDMVFYTKPASIGPGSAPNESLRITAMGDLYVGNESGYAIFDNSTTRPRFQFRQHTGTNRGTAFIETRGDANSMALYLAKSRGGNGTGVINSGDQLGTIQFTGADGTNQVTGAQILAYTSGTIAADRIPTSLSFYTHPDSTQGKVERFRITHDGYLNFYNDSNSNKGLRWYNNVGGSAKAASIEWGNGNANWEFKHFRNDNQADNPYANIDFFTGDWASPTRALRITNDGNHIREKHSRFATRIDYDSNNEAADETLDFKTAHVNVGNDFDASNNYYVAPVDGDYAFWFHTNVGRASGAYYVSWHKNGSEVNSEAGGRIYDQHSGSGWHNLSGCIMLSLDEGDQISIRNRVGSTNFDGNSYGQFMGWLVG